MATDGWTADEDGSCFQTCRKADPGAGDDVHLGDAAEPCPRPAAAVAIMPGSDSAIFL